MTANDNDLRWAWEQMVSRTRDLPRVVDLADRSTLLMDSTVERNAVMHSAGVFYRPGREVPFRYRLARGAEFRDALDLSPDSRIEHNGHLLRVDDVKKQPTAFSLHVRDDLGHTGEVEVSEGSPAVVRDVLTRADGQPLDMDTADYWGLLWAREREATRRAQGWGFPPASPGQREAFASLAAAARADRTTISGREPEEATAPDQRSRDKEEFELACDTRAEVAGFLSARVNRRRIHDQWKQAAGSSAESFLPVLADAVAPLGMEVRDTPANRTTAGKLASDLLASRNRGSILGMIDQLDSDVRDTRDDYLATHGATHGPADAPPEPRRQLADNLVQAAGMETSMEGELTTAQTTTEALDEPMLPLDFGDARTPTQ